MKESSNEKDVELVSEEGDKLENKIKALKEELKKCRRDKQDYLAGWQRAKADLINARKAMEKEKADFIKYAKEGVLLDFLRLADSFEAAFSSEGFGKIENNKWAEGMARIYQDLMKILESHHIVKIKSAGEKFNPAEHEVLEEREVEDKEKDLTVLQEIQSGYKLHNKVLRPARVVVGKYKLKNK